MGDDLIPPSQLSSANDDLNPLHRREAIERLKIEHLDVLVIGGGVTGIGCALDAASRGLSVAVVEQRDLASGTSSRSSKLIHGGLRYLQQFKFGLVREALSERNLLISQIAPHLINQVDFLYPLRNRGERLYAGLGIGLYDLMAFRGGNRLPRHKHLSRRQVQSKAAALSSRTHKGAIMFSDASVDDARYVISVARTAAQFGASILTSMKVTNLLTGNGRVNGAVLKCLETGREFDVSCGTVVNATGVWSDDIEQFAGADRPRVRASKGIHLVIPKDRVDLETGLILRTSDSVLFVIPAGNHWIVGTTDSDWQLDRAHPAATRQDIDYLLTTLNQILEAPITTDDVVGVYVGLRPLLRGDEEITAKLSREHAVTSSREGLVSISGGKYTTYRIMAQDTIDAVGVDQGRQIPDSTTSKIPLIGARNYEHVLGSANEISESSGVPLVSVKHLISRHGDRIDEVLNLIAADESLKGLIDEDLPYLRAEVIHSVRFEGALHLEDVLTRRTKISIESWDRGTDSALLVAELMARELEWDQSRIHSEVEHYLKRVESERSSNTQLDDQKADASRLAAGDIRESFA